MICRLKFLPDYLKMHKMFLFFEVTNGSNMYVFVMCKGSLSVTYRGIITIMALLNILVTFSTLSWLSCLSWILSKISKMYAYIIVPQQLKDFFKISKISDIVAIVEYLLLSKVPLNLGLTQSSLFSLPPLLVTSCRKHSIHYNCCSSAVFAGPSNDP